MNSFDPSDPETIRLKAHILLLGDHPMITLRFECVECQHSFRKEYPASVPLLTVALSGHPRWCENCDSMRATPTGWEYSHDDAK